ncbi:unnamed protein product [Rotaria socialis]|uniref:Uncharacterized protein n=1 Tax=Rotaria socialis TaxID=392032 RepID=A0A820UDP7_9BILA|nr:unnamed protein product [Rotaria socialis]CAF4486186.1 unnamed protein product [Rotaria socialis]
MPDIRWYILPAMLSIICVIIVFLNNPLNWLRSLFSSHDIMEINFPVNSYEVNRASVLLNDNRLASSIERFSFSNEVAYDTNQSGYLNALRNQFNNGDQGLLDYITRMEFTDEGQQFIKTMSIGRVSVFSMILIAHKRINGQMKILIAELKKEVTISIVSTLLSAPSRILGMYSKEQKEIEEIVSRFSLDENKKYFEALMEHIMADKLRGHLSNDVHINFIETKKKEL